jgi:hypothetical protein
MVNHSHKVSGKGHGAHSYHTPKSVEKSPKIHKVMHEFKHHELHSGSKHGPMVKNRKQAIAIALSEARKKK